jgi:hypothetical protein
MIAYKYLHPSRTNILAERLIRFTQAAALNDPFETTPNMRELEQSFRRHAIRRACVNSCGIYLAHPHWSSLRSLVSSGDSNLGFRL